MKEWTVVKCGWPYPDGYATINKSKNMILDTGLTKEHAEQICEELNNRKPTKTSIWKQLRKFFSIS
jgi:hypothetical protein